MLQNAKLLLILTVIILLLAAGTAVAQDGRWVKYDLGTLGDVGIGYNARGDGIVVDFPSMSSVVLIFDVQVGDWQEIDLNVENDFDYYDTEGHLIFAYSMSNDLLFGYSDIGPVWDTITVDGDIIDHDYGYGYGENLAYLITDQYLYIFDASVGEWVSYAYGLPGDYTLVKSWVMEDFVGVVFNRPNPALPKDVVYSAHTRSFNTLEEGLGYNPDEMDHGFAGTVWIDPYYSMIGYSAYDNQFSIENYTPTDEIMDMAQGPFYEYDRKVDEYTTYMTCYRYAEPNEHVNANHYAYDTRQGVWVHQYTKFVHDVEGFGGDIRVGGQFANDAGVRYATDNPHYIMFDGTNNLYRSPLIDLNMYDNYVYRSGGVVFLAGDDQSVWGYNVADNLGDVHLWLSGTTAKMHAGQEFATATRWSEERDDMRTYFYNARTNHWSWIDTPEHWNHHNELLTSKYYLDCNWPENEAIFYSASLDQILYHDFEDDGSVSFKIRGDLAYAAGVNQSVLFNGVTGNDIGFSTNVATYSQNGLGTNSAVFCDADDHTLYGYSMKSNTVTPYYMPENPSFCVDTGFIGVQCVYYNGNGTNKVYTYNSYADSWIELIPEGNPAGFPLVGKRTALIKRTGIGYASDVIYAFDPQRSTTDVNDDDHAGGNRLPAKFELAQNYPNPFNPETAIKYSVPYRADVTIDVFNILGRKVTTLVNENKTAGEYEVIWDGNSRGGKTAASGVYFYRLKAGDQTLIRKMLLMK